MRGLAVAIRFLTVFPVGRGANDSADELGRSMAWFPAVGALQGLLLVAAWQALSTLLPEAVVAGLLVLILALTNGALHLDGFADTVDGLAGGKSPEQRLRIMRDSSTGAVGVVFVVVLLLLKFLAISELPAEVKPHAIFLFPVAGRWAMVPLAFLAPYARASGGLGAAFAGGGPGVLLKATALAAALSAVVMGLFSALLLALLGAAVFFSARYFKGALGGVTGDVFGFHSEAAEVAFLLGVLAMAGLLSTGAYPD